LGGEVVGGVIHVYVEVAGDEEFMSVVAAVERKDVNSSWRYAG